MLRSVEVQFRPLEGWPEEVTLNRRRAPFKATFSRTCDELDLELLKLGVRRLVIEIALPQNKIRRDGMPYHDARPAHPGVILSFESPRVGPLRYPCDTFSTWQDNIRAIARTLNAQRMIDRYGVTRRNEQYTGWSRLPPPSTDAQANGFGSHRDAAAYLAESGIHEFRGYTQEHQHELIDDLCANPAVLQKVYRAACVKWHPDHNGGDDLRFKMIQAARRMLEAAQPRSKSPCRDL